MQIKYEAAFLDKESKYNVVSYDTDKEAAAAIEAIGQGTVTKVIWTQNAPFCLPELVSTSVRFWRYENGLWHQIMLHDAIGWAVDSVGPTEA